MSQADHAAESHAIPSSLDDRSAPSTTDLADYHPLAQDTDGQGSWGWVDRAADRVATWLNPILIKEARQSLKSRQFVVMFFCLLLASSVWTLLGVIFNSPDVY